MFDKSDFFAKQTQYQVFGFDLSSSLTSKYSTGTFGEMKKQSQFKPNQSQFWPKN
jgi:hypothetical protein